MSSPSEPRFHETDRGYLAHWRRVGPLLESIQREEARCQGSKPNDGQVVDSLLQLGYLHRDPDRRPTSLIQWQARLKAAYARQNAISAQRDQS